MSDLEERFRAFLKDAPHWLELLAAVPARHVLRHDTVHPVFHGCIDWHSACHAIWALIAYQGLSGSEAYGPIVDDLLMPEKLARELADLKTRPEFEMPYGRAWFLRLAVEDRLVTGSTRLAPPAREVAASLMAHYRVRPPEPFRREYANASWALLNLFDYGLCEKNREAEEFARSAAADLADALDRLPSADEEESWPDFMAVTPNLAELLLRTGAIDAGTLIERVGPHLCSMRPIVAPRSAHHHALNFSRAWAFFALYEAAKDERFLALYLDHMNAVLARPSWWRGDYRAVSHWVPQFGIFALQRAMRHKS